jgi:hypothetical protein
MRALASLILSAWLGLFGRHVVHTVGHLVTVQTLEEACAGFSDQDLEYYNDSNERICP